MAERLQTMLMRGEAAIVFHQLKSLITMTDEEEEEED